MSGYEEIRRVFNAEGTDALDPLDIVWLIGEVGRLRDVEAAQDSFIEELLVEDAPRRWWWPWASGRGGG